MNKHYLCEYQILQRRMKLTIFWLNSEEILKAIKAVGIKKNKQPMCKAYDLKTNSSDTLNTCENFSHFSTEAAYQLWQIKWIDRITLENKT